MSYQPLAPCPSCRRHVRLVSEVCPFCAGSMEGAVAIPVQTRRMSRGAVFAFASSVAIAGCGGSVETPPTTDAAKDTLTPDTGGTAPLYGAPEDTGDMGTIDAAYGAPVDSGGGGALYGAAPDR